MSDALKTVVVLDADVSSADVTHALPGGSGIEITAVIDGLEEARMRLHDTAGDIVMIFTRSQSESVIDLVEYSVRATPGRPVVVLGYAVGAAFTRRAFAVGAADLIELPAQAEYVVFSLQKAMARKVTTTETPVADRAPLICVLGPKGGTGKTLTATSLAVALAECGKRVALVDLDLQFGDVGLMMAVAPERTIHTLVQAGGSLDVEKLDDFLILHPTGVKLLLAPTRPDQASVVTVEKLREIFAVLRKMVDFVIVDTPPGFTPEVIATIDVATSVVLVSMLDALSLKNSKLGLETLDLMGFPSHDIKLVLNRARSRVGITEGEVVTVIGRTPDILVPSDRDIPRAVNEGTPILVSKPQSEVSQAYRQLARSYLGEEAPAAAPAPAKAGRQGLFSRGERSSRADVPSPPVRPKRQSLFARHILKRDADEEVGAKPQVANAAQDRFQAYTRGFGETDHAVAPAREDSPAPVRHSGSGEPEPAASDNGSHFDAVAATPRGGLVHLVHKATSVVELAGHRRHAPDDSAATPVEQFTPPESSETDNAPVGGWPEAVGTGSADASTEPGYEGRAFPRSDLDRHGWQDDGAEDVEQSRRAHPWEY